jgi:hypothetical protein
MVAITHTIRITIKVDGKQVKDSRKEFFHNVGMERL